MGRVARKFKLVVSSVLYNKSWRAGRVIAGLVIARWLGGRKVRTPSSARKSQRGNTPRPSGLGVKGNAPGNVRGAVWVAQASACAVRSVHGKCHREYTAGGAQHGGIAQENLRDVFESLASFGKGEKVG